MVVVWIVIGVVVAIAALLTVLEVQNRRRAKLLAHLEPVDPTLGARTFADAEGERAMTQGLATAAHPGTTGVSGGLAGS
ncbi:hypothetical protein [Curtobacterium sp. VKM Ac-1393]|uniref:hypothetical protein n=1 Tax=Curtobacterium sp. VKM Ac-1393 TaxID=2783814 RepID=UPI00188C85B2|nr:hypothetical protein [Curtobacterium sp. VKM Ac-1393]MBF4608175.1 hypothetical protein [Curtobacterium sp. VKM Ac-1393]